MRGKYHQEPQEKMLSNYKEAAEQHWILNKYVLTTDMPESRGIHPFATKWSVEIFTPTKLKKIISTDVYEFSHLTYNPRKKSIRLYCTMLMAPQTTADIYLTAGWDWSSPENIVTYQT